MVSLSEESNQRRREFIQHIFDKIPNIPKSKTFYTHTFYIFASIGLQLKVKVEKFYEHEAWDDFGCREELLPIILAFLKKYIR